MKILLFVLFISTITIYPQWERECSPKVEEFMNIVEEQYQNINSLQKYELTFSPEELETIVKKMYNAIADDPVGYEKYINKKHKEWDKNLKEKKINTSTPRFGWIIHLIENEISEKYSPEFISLIKIPYFLKIKITAKSHKVIQDVVLLDQTVLEGKTEEVVKGQKNFNKGDNITISYLNLSKSDQNCKNDFEIGKVYFIPIVVTTFDNTNFNDLVIKFLNDNNCSVYLIENDIIKTPGNYFKLMEGMNWNEFRKQFIKKYIIQ